MDLLQFAEAKAPAAAFDYATLPTDLADRQRERAARIAGIFRRTVEAAGEIGRELLAAQEELEHGQFLQWVDQATGLSKSSAYRFMDIARTFGAKLPTVGNLPLTVVHKLAEKSTPEPVRAAVLKRIEAGETVKAETILDELREVKETARKQAAEDKEAARRAALTPELRDEEDALRGRGEKKQAALARKEERERAAHVEQRRQELAVAAVGAAFLVDRLGADDAAAFFARFDYHALSRIMTQAKNLAHARRAGAVAPIDIPAGEIGEAHRHGFAWLSPEEKARAQELAERFQAGEPIEPIVVIADQKGRFTQYEIVEGLDRYRALRDVLHHDTIPARIAPPVDPQAAAAIGSADV